MVLNHYNFSMKKFDLIVIGAGAAGVMAASVAARRELRVAVLDMGDQPLRKVLASGGGRCNFTNSAVGADRYFGENPKFAISALSAFTPFDLLEWARARGLSSVEKSPGQYFCGEGAGAFAKALLADIGAEIFTDVYVEDVLEGFVVKTSAVEFEASKIIIATGGASYAQLGVSDVGYKIAKKFGHKIVPPCPALVGLKTDVFGAEFSGLSLMAEVRAGRSVVRDSLLFTHFGIGGPAAYRASLFDLSDGIEIDFMPGVDAYRLLLCAKKSHGAEVVSAVLARHLPARFANWVAAELAEKRLADLKDALLLGLSKKLHHFKINAVSRRGFEHAEITKGGVSTAQISSKTFESKLVPGLYFIGEVLDIAGDLGGFNLHFAFASGVAAGAAV